MAKITLTFEDNPEGGVKVVAEPSFETLMKKMASGHDLTAADGYAISALNTVRKISESNSPNKILIPKVRTSSL